MSEQVTPPDGAAPQDEGAAKKGSKTPLLAGLALVGALLGGGLGTFVVAPRLVAGPAAADSAAGDGAATDGGEHGASEDSLEGHGARGTIFKVENLIVNPAGSEGTRFLMTTVAFETDEETDAKLRAREIEVRDRIIAILEVKSLAALTQLHARDTLKAQLARAVAPVVGPRAPLRVFLPQFVIQ